MVCGPGGVGGVHSNDGKTVCWWEREAGRMTAGAGGGGELMGNKM